MEDAHHAESYKNIPNGVCVNVIFFSVGSWDHLLSPRFCAGCSLPLLTLPSGLVQVCISCAFMYLAEICIFDIMETVCFKYVFLIINSLSDLNYIFE